LAVRKVASSVVWTAVSWAAEKAENSAALMAAMRADRWVARRVAHLAVLSAELSAAHLASWLAARTVEWLVAC
jgi:hypothetical protein